MCQLLVQLKKPPRRRQSIKGEDAEITYFSQARKCPHRVMSRRTAAPPGRSVPGGEADEIGGKADDAARRSAFVGGAVVPATWSELHLLAISGHSTSQTPSQTAALRRADLAFKMDGLRTDQPLPENVPGLTWELVHRMGAGHNAVMSAVGYNLRLILKWVRQLLRQIIDDIWAAITPRLSLKSVS